MIMIKIKNKITWIVIFFCILLFFYNLQPFKIPTKTNRYLSIWKFSNNIFIIKIFPQSYYVLIYNGYCYIYENEINDGNTYILATRLDTNVQYNVLNYTYLLERVSNKIPTIFTYKGSNVIDILNELSY